MNIAINDVTIPKGRRKPTEDRIKSIARSMEAVGLLHPIVINEDQHLIAGQTRLLAAKKLGWPEIPMRILKLDAIHTELAEIVENIERSNLSTLEEAEALKRMKEIYLVLYPKTKRGGDRKSNAHKKISKRQNVVLKNSTEGTARKTGKSAQGHGDVSDILPPTSNTSQKTSDKMSSVLPFTKDIAQKTGRSQRSVQRDIALAEKLTDVTKTQITGTKVENSKVELKRLADLPPKQQEKVAKVIGSGKAKTVTEAKKIARVKDNSYQDITGKAAMKTGNIGKSEKANELLDPTDDFEFPEKPAAESMTNEVPATPMVTISYPSGDAALAVAKLFSESNAEFMQNFVKEFNLYKAHTSGKVKRIYTKRIWAATNLTISRDPIYGVWDFVSRMSGVMGAEEGEKYALKVAELIPKYINDAKGGKAWFTEKLFSDN